MKIDFKITTWERVNVPVHLEAEILAKIKTGEITSSDDIYHLYDEVPSIEQLFEVSEQIAPRENEGAATIEILNDENDVIFRNGY